MSEAGKPGAEIDDQPSPIVAAAPKEPALEIPSYGGGDSRDDIM